MLQLIEPSKNQVESFFFFFYQKKILSMYILLLKFKKYLTLSYLDCGLLN